MKLLSTVFLPLIFSLFLSYLLNPVVTYLEKQRVPKKWGILIVYLIFFVLLCLSLPRLLNELLHEMESIAIILPRYINELIDMIEKWHQDYERINIPPFLRQLVDDNLRNLQENTLRRLEVVTTTLLQVLSQVLSLLLIPIFTFYFLKDGAIFKRRLVMAVPSKYRPQVLKVLNEINKTVGLYLRGTIIVSAMVGAMVYLGLLILGVRFSLLLGLFNGLTNFIPYFGPFIGAVPTVILAYIQSPYLALKVIILLVVIQQLESFFLVPQILGRSLGFHPITVIILILIGSVFFGFVGLVFAVPVAAVIRTCWKHFHSLKFPLR